MMHVINMFGIEMCGYHVINVRGMGMCCCHMITMALETSGS